MSSVPKIEPLYPRAGRILQNDPKIPVIRFEVPVRAEHVAQFSKVIGWEGTGIPPTFFTFFRWGEFEILRRVGIPLEHIVHTDQSYKYHAKIEPGVVLVAESEVIRLRRRTSLTMLQLTTRLKLGDVLVVSSECSFVAKGGTE